MSHIHAVVISCGDWRFHDPREHMGNMLFRKKADLLTLPGAALCTSHTIEFESSVDNSTHYITSDAALEQLHLYITAHRPDQIWIVAHEDCAAVKMIDTEGELQGIPLKEYMAGLAVLYQDAIDILERVFGLPVKLFFQTLGNEIIKL